MCRSRALNLRSGVADCSWRVVFVSVRRRFRAAPVVNLVPSVGIAKVGCKRVGNPAPTSHVRTKRPEKEAENELAGARLDQGFVVRCQPGAE